MTAEQAPAGGCGRCFPVRPSHESRRSENAIHAFADASGANGRPLRAQPVGCPDHVFPTNICAGSRPVPDVFFPPTNDQGRSSSIGVMVRPGCKSFLMMTASAKRDPPQMGRSGTHFVHQPQIVRSCRFSELAIPTPASRQYSARFGSWEMILPRRIALGTAQSRIAAENGRRQLNNTGQQFASPFPVELIRAVEKRPRTANFVSADGKWFD